MRKRKVEEQRTGIRDENKDDLGILETRMPEMDQERCVQRQ
jgi:hypothetical protein